MKIVVIHGQSHKGITYAMVHAVLRHLMAPGDDLKEFFLPGDGPEFCCGCNVCFTKGEHFCPSAKKVQPIVKVWEEADVIILSSPNYVMEMCGAMKNLMDHLAYRWVTHRPHCSMFRKIGVVVSSSAGASPRRVVKSMANQLHWMCVPKVYSFALVSHAMGLNNLKEGKRQKMEKRAAQIAKAVKKRQLHLPFGLRSRIYFAVFRGMQSHPKFAWNPIDQAWWKEMGWLGSARPWKSGK